MWHLPRDETGVHRAPHIHGTALFKLSRIYVATQVIPSPACTPNGSDNNGLRTDVTGGKGTIRAFHLRRVAHQD